MLFLFFTQNCIYPSKHLLHCSLHIQGAIWVSFRFCCLFFFSCCDLTLSANAAKKKSKCRGQIFAQRSNFSTSDVSFSDRLCGEPIFNFAQSTSFSSSYICQHLENLKHNLDFFFSFLCRSSKIGVASCKPILFDCMRSSSAQQIIFEMIFEPFF